MGEVIDEQFKYTTVMRSLMSVAMLNLEPNHLLVTQHYTKELLI